MQTEHGRRVTYVDRADTAPPTYDGVKWVDAARVVQSQVPPTTFIGDGQAKIYGDLLVYGHITSQDAPQACVCECKVPARESEWHYDPASGGFGALFAGLLIFATMMGLRRVRDL